MKQRKIGDLTVSAVGFGCMGLSLAWMLCKKPWIVPIHGTTKTERIRENAAAADVVLTPEEIGKIDAQLDRMNLKVFGGI